MPRCTYQLVPSHRLTRRRAKRRLPPSRSADLSPPPGRHRPHHWRRPATAVTASVGLRPEARSSTPCQRRRSRTCRCALSEFYTSDDSTRNTERLLDNIRVATTISDIRPCLPETTHTTQRATILSQNKSPRPLVGNRPITRSVSK